MRYKLFIILLYVAIFSYAAENKYYYIVDAVNNSIDIAAEQNAIFDKIQNIIYQKSFDEITNEQLKKLTIIQLGDLLKHIYFRVRAVKKIDTYDAGQQHDNNREAQRLLRLKTILKSEYNRWADFFVTDTHGCKKHMYIYCANRHTLDWSSAVRMSSAEASLNRV